MTGRLIRPLAGWIVAMIVAMAGHAALALLFVGHVWTTALGISLAMGVMLAFCAARYRRAHRPMRWRWAMLAVALMLWLCAYWAIAWLQATYAEESRVYFDQLFFSLRIVPYMLILARTGSGDEARPYRIIDVAQALLVAGLILWLLYPSIVPALALTDPSWPTRTTAYHMIENVATALLALLAVVAQQSPDRRRFGIALAAMLGSYALLATGMNHWLFDTPATTPPGHIANVTADMPFFAFLLAYAGARRPARRRRHSTMIGMLMPTAFCGAAVVVAFAIDTPGSALVAGIALALAGFRAALLQSDLARLERFVTGLVDHLPDAVCVVAGDGTVRSANPAAMRLFGAGCIGSPFARLRAGLGQPNARDGAIETPDGRTFAIAEAALDETETVVRLTDITSLRLAEREREDALQLLGHDIRSPYATILTLLDGQPHGDPVLADRLRPHARHGLAIADDFVRLARARTATLIVEPIDLVDAAAEAAEMATAKARGRGVLLETVGGDREYGIWIDGDRGLLIRAMHNLLNNAIRFADAGMTVRYGVFVDGDRVCMVVDGEGPEMPEDRRADPFARFGGRGDRVGLGLALVQLASTRHGGIARYRREDARNVFSIELPFPESFATDEGEGGGIGD